MYLAPRKGTGSELNRFPSSSLQTPPRRQVPYSASIAPIKRFRSSDFINSGNRPMDFKLEFCRPTSVLVGHPASQIACILLAG